ncbi:DUF423 domain-containing protein [Carnimonas nigrificans]|uniref:DUF423 domain-containing protein n=1 Tax=Carnimonas nigrificans TaxID=64323 RepID=UPI001FE2224F|nr:DUF423 domain-containing protein [Carnimonas nigrificans]
MSVLPMHGAFGSIVENRYDTAILTMIRSSPRREQLTEVDVSATFHQRLWVVCAISGALTIALGAFGAHSLSQYLSPAMLNAFHTGVTYQMWHTIALMALLGGWRAALPRVTLCCWIGGTVLFSGSLYALALSGVRPIAFLTPVGGTLLIIGWVALAVSGWRHASRR